MIDLSGLLPKLLNATGSNAELAEEIAKIAWTRAAGEGLRNHAVPFRLYRRTLIVSVADAIWQKQLRQMSREFIFRINKLLGRSVVDEIVKVLTPEQQQKWKSMVGATYEGMLPPVPAVWGTGGPRPPGQVQPLPPEFLPFEIERKPVKFC